MEKTYKEKIIDLVRSNPGKTVKELYDLVDFDYPRERFAVVLVQLKTAGRLSGEPGSGKRGRPHRYFIPRAVSGPPATAEEPRPLGRKPGSPPAAAAPGLERNGGSGLPRHKTPNPRKKRRYKKPGSPPQERIRRECLKCGRPFTAKGRFNRVCPKCADINRHINDSWYTAAVPLKARVEL
jgi:hypothetical protein